MNRKLQPKHDEQSLPQSIEEQPRPVTETFLQRLTHLGGISKLISKSNELLLHGKQKLGPIGFGHALMGVGAGIGAIATGLNIGLVELLERQAQTTFFQLRGAVEPPADIVILSIDEQSIDQGTFYEASPGRYPYLEPLSRWPWQRRAYAIAIQKLIEAGADAVAIDLVLDTPSSWGSADDEALQQALQQYGDRVVLASSYEDREILSGQGTITQLIEPLPSFRVDGGAIGFINYWIELDGRIHRRSQEFPLLLAQQYPEQAEYFQSLYEAVPSFDRITLKAAQADPPPREGENIFFYGPQNTFQQISFWSILEPENWEKHLQRQDFKDKVVLIGPTASLFQDSYDTPFGSMSGVEIHANSIATLLEGRSLVELLPEAHWRGGFLGVWAIAVGVIVSRPRRIRGRCLSAASIVAGWGFFSYTTFVVGGLILPTAMPMAIAAFGGVAYIVAGLARDNLHKLQLRDKLKQYSSSPIIREIIKQQDDLRDLIQEREQEALGKQLVGRYQIIEVLGAGGFGETYIAADNQRPGNPLCVVKQLRPASNDPKLFELSQRLFQREAETLERLGRHDQIPQLLAYFEEGKEFYLVQEFIDGHPLRHELVPGQRLTEVKVIEILKDLLEILEFIHGCGVIHRDIKPSNVIRRHSDQRLVLIDFGAVKEIHTQFIEDQSQANTIGIGTRGYMPNEQYAGNPRLNSDLYAVGMIGIQALTGLPPDRLGEDFRTGEILWQDKADISPELEAILSIMTRYNFSQRYQTASEALEDLRYLYERYRASGEVAASHAASDLDVLLEEASEDWADEPTLDPNLSTLPWLTALMPDGDDATTTD